MLYSLLGVGLEFNHLFGFGVLDAGAMVALAKQWKTVPARWVKNSLGWPTSQGEQRLYGGPRQTVENSASQVS